MLMNLDRARKFEYFAEQGISAFHVEQAFQLYLKFILAKELGYFPKTHSLSKLFKELARIDKKFHDFYEENEIILRILKF